jgi:hypothetical protein
MGTIYLMQIGELASAALGREKPGAEAKNC